MFKRIGLLAVFALTLLVPLTVGAQEMTGASIEDIASSVVLIESIDGRRALSSGSGTIISPDGYIYTNRHVIEDGDDFAIYMLDDIRERPVLRYYASLQYQSRNIDIDFAILKIDRDERGREINARNEALPYLIPASKEVNVGDTIRIFGYPGIGDGYMVVTTGEVVTVQNGSVDGNRLPVWYWTDAEISGGNSGGLAVNEAGEVIGLPTWVISEERTAGRLGGVLPLGAVEMMLAADNYTIDAPGAPSAPDAPDRVAQGNVLTLVNDSDAPICFVYISPTNARDWGDDQLGDREIVAQGDSYDFSFEVGAYDVLLLDCNGDTLQDERGVTLDNSVVATFDGTGLLFAAPTAPSTPTLTIVNMSDETICYVYISPSSASNWGDDQLDDSEVLEAGSKRAWQVEPEAYDVMLQDCNRDVLEDVRGVTISGAEVLEYE